ncbi:uncharacterized protein PG986_003937 [Apiospora aurea]|uniref:Alcohol acetyltransferase n=1 Tax=Apiospora aurea TaxID=335848 RepID=A0ABR1QL69_9PEZI
MAPLSQHGADTSVLRKFGINEAYQLAMYILDQYRGTILSCRYEIPSRLASAEARLEEAVKAAIVDTIMRHPMLQVGMADATSKSPSWVQLDSLDLTQHIKWNQVGEHDDLETTVQETFCAQLDDRFPDFSVTLPNWRVTIFRQGRAPSMEVMLTWNHPQFDGAGAKVFHEDFLELLNANENGEYARKGLEVNSLRLPEAPPMLPTPIEDLKKMPVDIKYLSKVFWEEIRPSALNRDKSMATWCPIRTSPYKTQFRSFSINNAALSAILTLCRQNKTTVTGLIHGVALLAFSLHLNSKAAPAFQSSTVMDHRRNLPPAPADAPWGSSDRAVANYVTQAVHKYDSSLVKRIRSKMRPSDAAGEGEGKGKALSADLISELWAVSAQSRRQIERRLEVGLRNDLVGIFKFVTDWQKTMGDMAKRKRQFSWLVTNIGVMDGKGSNSSSSISGDQDDVVSGWSISRAQFGLSAETPAAAIEFSPVSVAGRGMWVGANWADCAVDVTLGERIMGDMERWLNQLASQP